MSLFRLVAKIGIDATEFNAGLKKAESGVSASMATIGARVASAFSVAAIVAWTAKVANAANEIGDLADQLSITTDEVQQLQKAADRSGVSFDRYAAALGKIRKLKADFAAGDFGAAQTFAKTGLNPNETDLNLLKQMGGLPDAQFFEILGEKSIRLKNSVLEIKALGPLELIRKEDIDAIKSATDGYRDQLRVIIAITSHLMGPQAARAGILSAMISKRFGKQVENAIPPAASDMPEGFSMTGRDSGSLSGPAEMFGPTNDEAKMQLYLRQARRRNASFSPVPTGDRANVGGFFGPNADVNNRMASDLTKISKGIDAIDNKLLQALTTP